MNHQKNPDLQRLQQLLKETINLRKTSDGEPRAYYRKVCNVLDKQIELMQKLAYTETERNELLLRTFKLERALEEQELETQKNPD